MFFNVVSQKSYAFHCQTFVYVRHLSPYYSFYTCQKILIKDEEAKNEFFNSFIYRVVLFDDGVCIFYNMSQTTPTKVKLDKEELHELNNYRLNKQSTQFEPYRLELGAAGGVCASLIELLIEF